jgi:hypothetical protein
MQAYINYLLEDIAAAQRAEQSFAEQPSLSIEDHFAEVERWIAGDEPGHSFSYYCGLKPEQFPPAEMLTKKQMRAICKTLNHLLCSWNLDVDIPKQYPIVKTYQLLVTVLDKKVEPPTSGFITFEFCTCDPPTCPFEDHCTCKKYFGLPDDNMSKHDDAQELPF